MQLPLWRGYDDGQDRLGAAPNSQQSDLHHEWPEGHGAGGKGSAAEGGVVEGGARGGRLGAPPRGREQSSGQRPQSLCWCRENRAPRGRGRRSQGEPGCGREYLPHPQGSADPFAPGSPTDSCCTLVHTGRSRDRKCGWPHRHLGPLTLVSRCARWPRSDVFPRVPTGLPRRPRRAQAASACTSVPRQWPQCRPEPASVVSPAGLALL